MDMARPRRVVVHLQVPYLVVPRSWRVGAATFRPAGALLGQLRDGGGNAQRPLPSFTVDHATGALVDSQWATVRVNAMSTVDRRGKENLQSAVAAARETARDSIAVLTLWKLATTPGRLVADLAPSLLALTGCGPLTAAKLVGETAGIGRFRSRAAFARHNGSAPLPVWSGNTERHRLSRTGNRQLNVPLHRIAITQLQREGPGKAYLEHRRDLGNTKTEAIRALRRRISDEVFRRMRHDEAARAASPSGFAAAA